MSLTIGSLFGIAYSGLHTRELEMATISNNIANVHTAGYKRVQAITEDQVVPDAEAASELWLPSGTYLAATRRLEQQGAIETTGGTWDLALDGPGFLQVQETNGTISYTRGGTLRVDGGGRLVMEDGARVLPQVTMPLNAQNTYIGRNGIIQAQVNGQTQQVGTIQVARFTNPEGLQMIGSNRYVATAASGPSQVAQAGTQGYAEVVSGALERSNVDLGAEMVTMIGVQRIYSLTLRMLQTTDRMHALAVELRA